MPEYTIHTMQGSFTTDFEPSYFLIVEDEALLLQAFRRATENIACCEGQIRKFAYQWLEGRPIEVDIPGVRSLVEFKLRP